MLRHALPRLPAALALVISPRLVGHRATTAHLPRRLSSQPPGAWRKITAAARKQGAAAGAQQGAHPTRDGDGVDFTSIDELTASLKALTGDPLEVDGGNIVVYRGSPTAAVMLIGQDTF